MIFPGLPLETKWLAVGGDVTALLFLAVVAGQKWWQGRIREIELFKQDFLDEEDQKNNKPFLVSVILTNVPVDWMDWLREDSEKAGMTPGEFLLLSCERTVHLCQKEQNLPLE